MTITEAPSVATVRRFLRRPGPWIGLAYFALIFVFLYLYADHRDSQVRARLAATSAVTSCFEQRRDNPDLAKLIGLLAFVADSAVRTTKAVLATTSDPELRRIRLASISRNTLAREAAQKFRARIEATTPTLTECKARASALGVDPRAIREQVEAKSNTKSKPKPKPPKRRKQ